MSFLQRVFHKKPKAPPPTLAEAIQKFAETEKMLRKKVVYLESRLEKEIENAKKNATKNKPAALQALKRKKCLEKQLQKIDGALTTLEVQREAMEDASEKSNVLASMQIGREAIAAANKYLTPDNVTDMMDNLAEMAEDQNKIAGAIRDHPSNEGDLDIDELEKELAELELSTSDDEKQSSSADKDKLDEKEPAELAAFGDDVEKQPKAAKSRPSVPAAAAVTSSRPNSKPPAVPAEDIASSNNTRKKEKAAALAS